MAAITLAGLCNTRMTRNARGTTPYGYRPPAGWQCHAVRLRAAESMEMRAEVRGADHARRRGRENFEQVRAPGAPAPQRQRDERAGDDAAVDAQRPCNASPAGVVDLRAGYGPA